MKSWLSIRGIVAPGTRSEKDRGGDATGRPVPPYPLAAVWHADSQRMQRLGVHAGLGREGVAPLPARRPPGRPPGRPLAAPVRPWQASDLLRLVSALSGSEGSRDMAASLSSLLAKAADGCECSID